MLLTSRALSASGAVVLDGESSGAVILSEMRASEEGLMEFLSRTPEQTREFGVRLGRVLRRGDLVILSGSLGAGKTALTQGIGVGLGVRGPIVSPTFVIARVHPSLSDGHGVPLVHVDAYRIGGLAEIDDLDLDESLGDSVTVVEWGLEKVERLANVHLEIQIGREESAEPATPSVESPLDDSPRMITLIPHGPEWIERVELFRKVTSSSQEKQ